MNTFAWLQEACNCTLNNVFMAVSNENSKKETANDLQPDKFGVHRTGFDGAAW
jgi:hypothetical protein